MYAYIFTYFAFPSVICLERLLRCVIMAGEVSCGRATYILGENIFMDFRILEFLHPFMNIDLSWK